MNLGCFQLTLTCAAFAALVLNMCPEHITMPVESQHTAEISTQDQCSLYTAAFTAYAMFLRLQARNSSIKKRRLLIFFSYHSSAFKDLVNICLILLY